MSLFSRECCVEKLPERRGRPTFAIVAIIAGESKAQRAILRLGLSVRPQTGPSFCCCVACTAVRSLKANRFVTKSGRITMAEEGILLPQIYVSPMSCSRSVRIVAVRVGLLPKMHG